MKPTTHLTSDEIAELLDTHPGPGAAQARSHLAACAECAAEFESLQETLVLFRESATAFAGRQLTAERLRANLPLLKKERRRAVSPQLVWAGAALVAVAAALPLHRHAPSAPSAATTVSATRAFAPARESDQALLEDIDRDLSASVPDSMEPLASPAAGSQMNLQTAPIRKN
jgi:anti-sigma factor RsiW